MQFSESWLRQFVNPTLTTEELAHVMTMAGLEVEETRTLAPPFQSVVVAEILEAVQHPDADRLRVCKVSVGSLSDAPLQIVCGAPNARVGIKIPCAMVGAELPASGPDAKPFQIKIGKLRGVESYGMLCSGKELGLGDDHAGILELPLDAPVGGNIREYLGLDDTIFTIKLTPNKADCLSVLGIAREVSALTGAPLIVPPAIKTAVTLKDTLKVDVRDTDLCGRFAGRIIRGVNAKAKTPDYIVKRLASAGQRSVSALVDLSNYVMLEMGQPTHVFDLSKIHGGLTVRWGNPDESLKLLNGNSITLSDAKLPLGVIADEKGIESLAGMMGGDHTAVTLETTDIYVESAFWWPAAIQGRARALNFSTDAAYRFERGVDPDQAVNYLEYLSNLILNVCGGSAGPVDDQALKMPKHSQITLRLARVEKIIGLEFSGNQIAEYFDRLEFAYARSHPGTPQETFVVECPRYRFDLQIEEDLIEEIARIFGFENIPEQMPHAQLRIQNTHEKKRSIHKMRHVIASQDYQEVVNYGFIDLATETNLMGNQDPIKVLNPLAEQYAVMRSSLFGSLLLNLKNNLSRKATRVRIFEMGRVFLKEKSVPNGPLQVSGIHQPLMVGGLAFGSVATEQWGLGSKAVDFFDVKADIAAILQPLEIRTKACSDHPALHPGRSAWIEVERENETIRIGVMGELHPKYLQELGISQAPVLFELDWSLIETQDLPSTHEISKFPAVERDLAIVLDAKVPAQDILDAMHQVQLPLIKGIQLFDEFRPTAERPSGMQLNEKSLAFRLTLVDEHQTLQEAQIEASVKSLLDQVLVQFSARLR